MMLPRLPLLFTVLIGSLIVVRTDALLPPALVHTAIGAMAGSAGAIAAYPIDYVKSQLQTEAGREKYKGGFDAAYDIVKTDGPLALYRGAMVNVIGVAPEKTIKLGVNDFMRTAMIAQFGHLPLLGEIVSGGIAGMTQVIVTNPLEVVKVRMQTSSMTIQQVMAQITSLGDLYEGAEACVVRDMVFSATLFPLYAHGKVALATILLSHFATAGGDASTTFWANLIAGSLAAAPAAFVSTPADVIKTRIQQAKEEFGGEPVLQATPKLVTAVGYSSSASRGFVSVGSDIVAQEGPAVLFSGWFERVIRSAPQFGVTLAMFDVLTSMAINHGYLLPETPM